MIPKQIKNKIIIGSWSWSGQYKSVSNKEVEEIIDMSIINGFNEFDTSPTYGKAEKILAKYKKKNKKILINTKCGWDRNLNKTFRPENLKDGIDWTLEKFGKINVIQLHNPRNEIKNWDEIINIIENYKKKKLINKLGISLARNHYFPLKVLNKFDFIQDEFNLLRIDPIYQMKKFKNCLAARSPFANGILTSNFNCNTKYSKNDHRFSWLKEKRLKNICKQKKILESMTNNKIEKFSIDFIFSFSMIDKVIFGVRKKKHFYDLIKNLENLEKLKKKKINEVINLNNRNYYFSRSENKYNN